MRKKEKRLLRWRVRLILLLAATPIPMILIPVLIELSAEQG